MCYGKRRDWSSLGGEEEADNGGLCCHHGHCDIPAWVAAKSHIWVRGPAAVSISVDVCERAWQDVEADQALLVATQKSKPYFWFNKLGQN